MNSATNHRVKKKYVSPNPLFVKWLTEWKQEAAEKGLKIQYTYGKALKSLKKYPLPLSTGKEAKILEYFGDKICSMLDAKLIEWKQASSSSSSSSQSSTEFNSSSSRTLSSQTSSTSCASSASTTSSASLHKTKKTSKAAESSIGVKTIHLGRVTTLPRPPETDSGNGSVCDASFYDRSCFYLHPGNFTIVLCVDNCETFSGQGRNKKLFLAELQKTGISLDVRKLHVGDFLWIAKENTGERRELVLDYIVERKRMDDLARSIKDGRFKEQKFRMKTCGLKYPIYLVENCRDTNYLGLPLSTCEQAIVNTQVIDGFMIKRTSNVKDSANYLTTMTNMIRKKFQDSLLMSASKETLKNKKTPSNTFMTFSEFNTSSMKNKSLTVREMFAKHLLQLHGLSVDRAAAIVDQFETPAKFFKAYDDCETEAEKEKLVSLLKFGLHKKNVGPALSRSLHQYYCAETLPK